MVSRLIWPAGILVACALCVTFAAIVWTGHSLDEEAVARDRARFLEAVSGYRSERARIVADMAADLAGAGDDEARGRVFRARFAGTTDLESVALVAEDGRRLAEVRAGHPVDLDAAASGRPPVASPGEGGTASVGIHADARGPYLSFAAVVDAAGRPATVIAHERMSAAALAGIAERHGLARFALETARPAIDVASLALVGANGTAGAYATWAAPRPGDRVRQSLVPLSLAALGLVAAIFGLVAGYLRWLARDVARTEARSRDLLGRDPLSGLANRLLFSERLDRELLNVPRSGHGLAVLFIDLDRFKDVNDTHGHQAGDDLIRLVAQRLVNLLRASDTIARFGGDEFAIIQTALRTPEDATALARRILDALTRPFALAHTQVIIGASIGVSLAPEHGNSRETLMGLADTALYQAKSEGRNRFSFFQTRMDETIRMRKVVEEDLRRAIAQDELLLHYQPLFSSDGTTVVAVEALVRWPHPTRGMISPSEFIAIAEERGLVIPLGEWVLRRACLDGKRWPGIRVAVNVSPIQFRHRDFVAGVVAMLEETGFEASRLELELTEGVVVEDADAAETAMMDLRALGIHLALDDFGTGYSSLIYLRRFAFDTIKIDRSFLESMEATGESAILVHSMVHLGRALGLTVTAEGVETREQHRFLQALGCHQLQGFLFSKPVPAAEIDAMLGIDTAAIAA